MSVDLDAQSASAPCDGAAEEWLMAEEIRGGSHGLEDITPPGSLHRWQRVCVAFASVAVAVLVSVLLIALGRLKAAPPAVLDRTFLAQDYTASPSVSQADSTSYLWTQSDATSWAKALPGGSAVVAPVSCNPAWKQCNGVSWRKATCCVDGFGCVKQTPWYWQCVQQAPQAMHSFGSGSPRILCFGDSLTAGYYQEGRKYAPYGSTLAQLLPATVWVDGMSGLTAELLADKIYEKGILDVTKRLGWGIAPMIMEKGTFDIALIMIGTNDLRSGDTPEHAFQAIRRLHDTCHELGVPSVALSVPPASTVYWDEQYKARWQALNRLIRDWSSEDEEVHFIDVEELVPYNASSKYWDLDGLHYLPEGSSLLGTKLAEMLKPLLNRQL